MRAQVFGRRQTSAEQIHDTGAIAKARALIYPLYEEPMDKPLSRPGRLALFGAFAALTAGPLAAQDPLITTLEPDFATVGAPAFTLTVNGKAFGRHAVVLWNGSERPTTFVNAFELSAVISESDLASAGTAVVTVAASELGGLSNAASFTTFNSVPEIASLLPSSATAGSATFTLTVNGSAFAPGCVVSFNGSPRQTVFVDDSLVRARILAEDVSSADRAEVTVANPEPGGGTSEAARFAVRPAMEETPGSESKGRRARPKTLGFGDSYVAFNSPAQ
jgi:hypothetical protein